MARSFDEKGHYLAALHALRQAVAECGDRTHIDCIHLRAKAKLFMANQHRRHERYKDAERLAQEAKQELHGAGLPTGRARLLVAKAIAGLGHPMEAVRIARQARRAGEGANDLGVMASAERLEGFLRLETGEPEAAQAAGVRARDLSVAASSTAGVAKAELLLSMSYTALGDLPRARQHLTQAEKSAAASPVGARNLSLLREHRVRLDILDGTRMNAISGFDRSLEARTELQRELFSSRVAEAEVEFETVLREHEIDRLRQEGVLAEMRLGQQRMWLSGAAILSLILVLVGLGLGVAWKRDAQAKVILGQQKKRLAKLAEELGTRVNERDQLLREIHHRVNGNLQIVSSFIGVHEAALSEASSFQQRRMLFADLQVRVKAIALVHHALYMGASVSSVPLAELVEGVCDQLRVVFGFIGELDVIEDMEDGTVLHLGTERAVPAALIACELVSNALEHGFAQASETSWVRVRLTRRATLPQPSIILEVENGGPGFKPADRRTAGSYGLRLVEQLSQKLEGRLTLRSDAKACSTLTSVAFPILPVGAGMVEPPRPTMPSHVDKPMGRPKLHIVS